MSSDQIGMPHAFVDYDGLVEVKYFCGEKAGRMVQPSVPFTQPCECCSELFMTVQSIGSDGEPTSPVYVYDYDVADWVTFNAKLHEYPESSPVDVEPQPEPTVEETVEYSDESAPTSDATPETEDELDEPSYDPPSEPEGELDDEQDDEEWE